MNDILESVSYDPYINIPSYDDLNKNVKIVFSNTCYKKILEMSNNTETGNREHGSFFVGKKLSLAPLVIYFDYQTSEFQQTSGPMGDDRAVIPTQQNYIQLNNKLMEYKSSGFIPAVLHFHTHTRSGYYESFSDQDLYVYAKMAYDNKKYDTFGMLGFPIKNSSGFGMCIVNPKNPELINGNVTADFVRCENIYYINGNDIYQVGSFIKGYNGRLSQPNLDNGIVKQYLILPYNAKVCAEGVDPNTGRLIEPTVVGYVDANNTLNFPNEYLALKTKITEPQGPMR